MASEGESEIRKALRRRPSGRLRIERQLRVIESLSARGFATDEA